MSLKSITRGLEKIFKAPFKWQGKLSNSIRKRMPKWLPDDIADYVADHLVPGGGAHVSYYRTRAAGGDRNEARREFRRNAGYSAAIAAIYFGGAAAGAWGGGASGGTAAGGSSLAGGTAAADLTAAGSSIGLEAAGTGAGLAGGTAGTSLTAGTVSGGLSGGAAAGTATSGGGLLGFISANPEVTALAGQAIGGAAKAGLEYMSAADQAKALEEAERRARERDNRWGVNNLTGQIVAQAPNRQTVAGPEPEDYGPQLLANRFPRTQAPRINIVRATRAPGLAGFQNNGSGY